MKLLVATQNPGKKHEYRQLLAPLTSSVLFPDNLGIDTDVREDGATYAENAHKKATHYARLSHLTTMADDSGLEVDALDGAPGIYSARYAPGSDEDRVAVLLENLRGVPWEERTARFRCLLVVVRQNGELFSTEGVCEGFITLEPRGSHGFGYDPTFYLPQYDATMAQLSPEEKNRISHRARAVAAALPRLR